MHTQSNIVGSDHEQFKKLCQFLNKGACIFAETYNWFLVNAIKNPMGDTVEATIEQKEELFAQLDSKPQNEYKVNVIMTRVHDLIGMYWRICQKFYEGDIPQTKESIVKTAFMKYFNDKYRTKCEKKYVSP